MSFPGQNPSCPSHDLLLKAPVFHIRRALQILPADPLTHPFSQYLEKFFSFAQNTADLPYTLQQSHCIAPESQSMSALGVQML